MLQIWSFNTLGRRYFQEQKSVKYCLLYLKVGEGNDNPLQYSSLDITKDGGA